MAKLRSLQECERLGRPAVLKLLKMQKFSAPLLQSVSMVCLIEAGAYSFAILAAGRQRTVELAEARVDRATGAVVTRTFPEHFVEAELRAQPSQPLGEAEPTEKTVIVRSPVRRR